MKIPRWSFPILKVKHLNEIREPLGSSVADFEKRQIIYSFLGLLILMGASIIMNTLHLQSVAEQSTRFVKRMMQMGSIRDASYVLEESLQDNFETIKFNSPRSDRSFGLPANEFIRPKQPRLIDLLYKDKIVVPFNDSVSGYSNEEFIFVYNRFALVPFAVLLWLFILLVSIPQTKAIKRRLTNQFEKDLALEKAKESERLSDEVRHNLRTPLASLMRIPARLPESQKQDRDLLNISIEQIKKLIAKIDHRKLNQEQDQNHSHSIYDSLIKSINQISTSIPFGVAFNFQIDDSLCSAKVSHVPVELQILTGNIINNSLDAFSDSKGQIEFIAKDIDPYLQIEISDNGPGIHPGIIDHVFNQGFTSGKANGTGLGLYHAKTQIEAWGGQINIKSEVNTGVKIMIRLPIHERYSWFVPRLKLNPWSEIYILDDQLTGRELWKLKLNESGFNSKVHLLSNSTEAKDILNRPNSDFSNTIFIFDFDLNESINGIDLLNLIPTHTRRYLSTGHFDKQEIRDLCETHRIYLIPKPEIPNLPVVVI
jgi:signal transduction histidine kinase